jgi:hypothetical protein
VKTHSDELPVELPPARVLADRCLDRAWADDVDDRDRLLLEQASGVIGELLARLAAATDGPHSTRAVR